MRHVPDGVNLSGGCDSLLWAGWARKMRAVTSPGPSTLVVELERLLAELELLIGARAPLNIVLDAVALDRLDDRDPRQVLQEDRMHLLVVIGALLGVHAEAGVVAEPIELRVAPVVADAA